MSHFNSLYEAALVLIPVMETERASYFQDFSIRDRVMDPNGLYAVEAEMEDPEDSDHYLHSDAICEALNRFAAASPAERLEVFKLVSRSYQDELAQIVV
ncbi:hypothetical protein ACFCQI_02935 [Rhodanobacter sp. FW102-FHT14D06]|uniref:Uncharacterized protein n=2 Tax=unclassified Rhodanobacter TaxID=2621553 RepID=A0AB74UW41_9GAMM